MTEPEPTPAQKIRAYDAFAADLLVREPAIYRLLGRKPSGDALYDFIQAFDIATLENKALRLGDRHAGGLVKQ